jgi:hypothetical protein
MLIRKNVPLKRIRIQIEGERAVKTQVLEDSGIEGILRSALVGRKLEEIERFSLQHRSPTMTDGAVFKFRRKMRPCQVRMEVQYQNLAGSMLRAQVTIPPRASIEELWAAMQLRIDERLDHPSLFRRGDERAPAHLPWGDGKSRFWSEVDLAQRLLVKIANIANVNHRSET